MTGNADIMFALNAWQAADAAMRAAVEHEIACRLHLQTLAFPSPIEGTNNAPLPDGTVLKGVFRNNYTLSQPEIETTLKLLPAAIRGELVKWKGELSQSAYKALEPAHKRIVNEILTIKPGRPSLEIVQPKNR